MTAPVGSSKIPRPPPAGGRPARTSSGSHVRQADAPRYDAEEATPARRSELRNPGIPAVPIAPRRLHGRCTRGISRDPPATIVTHDDNRRVRRLNSPEVAPVCYADDGERGRGGAGRLLAARAIPDSSAWHVEIARELPRLRLEIYYRSPVPRSTVAIPIVPRISDVRGLTAPGRRALCVGNTSLDVTP